MSDPIFPTEVLGPSSLPRQVYVIHPLRRRYWLHILLFLATVFTTLVVGARLQYNFSQALPQFQSDADIFPLIFHFAWKVLQLQATVPLAQLSLSPIAIAAWVGMFATSLNLLPGGQLDGGHILYALWPRLHRPISQLTVLALVPMGVFWWTGWLVWAALLLLSLMRHPHLPEYPPLSNNRRLLGWFALLMFVITVIPVPFAKASLLDVIKELRK